MPSYNEDITIEANGKRRIHLDQSTGNISLGGAGSDGDILLFGENATLDSTQADHAIGWLDGGRGNLMLGGNGHDGDIALFRSNAAPDYDFKKARMLLDAHLGNIAVGGNGADGDLLLFPRNASCSTEDATEATVYLDGDAGNLAVGGNGKDGDILVFPKDATISTRDPKDATIHIDGDAGDMLLQNADCAEEFDTVDPAVEPGTVVVLDDEGGVKSSTGAYDSRIAGIVSGAGGYNPGMVLDKKWDRGNRVPIALMGKVGCKADATDSSIEVGDLLTSADQPGYAMKADDPSRAFGAVIGKALEPLATGQGIIPVLVNLQ